MQTSDTRIWTNERMRALRRLHYQLGGTGKGWRRKMAEALGVSEYSLAAKLGREYVAGHLPPIVRMPPRARPPRPPDGPAALGGPGSPASPKSPPSGPESPGKGIPYSPLPENDETAVALHRETRDDHARRADTRRALSALLSEPLPAPRSCRWPLWANDTPRPIRDPKFCGAKAEPGQAWCAAHCATCYGPDWRDKIGPAVRRRQFA